jgi:hypothetical protein
MKYSIFKRSLQALSILLILVLVGGSSRVSAISQDDFNAIYGDHTYYQDVTATSCSGTSTSSSTPAPGAGLDYAGNPIFTEAQSQAIKDNQHFYESAAQKADIPWQMIAVIHSNETGFKHENPDDEQGVYQFYNHDGGPYPPGPVDDTEFQRQTDFVANFIKGKHAGLNAQSDAAAIKDAFWGFNGRAYVDQAVALGFPADQGYEGSPYVMNKADAQRDPAVNKTTWGQVKHENGPIEYPANEFYGAYVQYAAIAGISGGSCSGLSGPVRQKVVQLLQQELDLWKSGQLKDGVDSQKGDYFKYSQNQVEAWCADFASWIYNQAGYPLIDGNEGRVSYTGTVWDIGQKNEKFHSHLNDGSYTPKPGDLVIYSSNSHVEIVVAYDNGTVTTIAGNWGNTVAQHSFNISDNSIFSGNSVYGFVSPD